MMSVLEVHEKYKHLDDLLSDREWLPGRSYLSDILYDLWQAIKLYAKDVQENELEEHGDVSPNRDPIIF